MKKLLLEDKILNTDLKQLDINYYEYGCTEKYCPPELLNDKLKEKLKPKGAIAFLCGKTIEEITEINYLNSADNNDLKKIFKEILETVPENRLSIDKAIERLEKLCSNDDVINAAFKHL